LPFAKLSTAKMDARRRKTSPPNIIESIQQRLSPIQRELMGLGLVVLAIITLLSLFSITSGSVSDGWAALLRQLFGWGAVPVALGVGWLGILLLWGSLRDESEPLLRWDVIIGVELLLVSGLSLLHLFVGGDEALTMAYAGAGGGIVGWAISTLLMDLVGKLGAGAILVLLLMAAVGLLMRLSSAGTPGWLRSAHGVQSAHGVRSAHGVQSAHGVRGAHGVRSAHGVQTEAVAGPQGFSRVVERFAAWLSGLGQMQEELVAGEETSPKRKASRRRKPKVRPEIEALPLQSQADESATRAARRSSNLPPLDLLVPSSKDPARKADARYQAQIIEETLQGFGVPAEVREINVGPAVTQFGVEPGYIERPGPEGTTRRHRVRVSKISSLVNDLALALAAAPIRIEAPVPGRPIIGIEVPNSKVSLVSLRGVLESEVFRKEKGFLRIPLGRDVSGAAVTVDLAAMPHLLIAGATGSGKSVCINSIISGLLCDHPSDELKFLMVDPKMVELTGFDGIPHLLAPVIVDIEQVVGALAWITRMMDGRYQKFSDAGARNIADYNKKIARRRGDEQLPYIIVIIDELADLMMMAPDETERYITRIAQMARATGIHLVIATQRPSTDVVTGLIKANFPARIAFAVTSQIDSRVILDTPGAERLLGRGDMLLMLPDSPKLQRLQGCFVSDGEMRKIVDFWKETAGELPATVSRPWDGLMAEAERDDMLDEAIELVVETGRASTTFLQRRLGIGYPRASRLMDQLEEEGIVGPAEGSRPREVLVGQDDEYDDYGDEGDEAWDA
jgi:S-DNA-T family DNA segregation ATPase FtsK/SpoIIIE